MLDASTRQRLRERGLVIYLRATADEVFRRTRRDKSRPLLQTENPRERIEQLLAEREPLYAETAHLTFQSAASNPKRLVGGWSPIRTCSTSLGWPLSACTCACPYNRPMQRVSVGLAGRS